MNTFLKSDFKNQSNNFLIDIITSDLDEGLNKKKLKFRFPPEPNGYLHIGHAKSIVLNFGLAIKFGGLINLRFDDTNPQNEDPEFIESIKSDIKWLGFTYDAECYASDYFDTLYDWAIFLIKNNHAYVDDQSQEQIALQKGTPITPGKSSSFRNRDIDENLNLFQKMKNGNFNPGDCVLRAKIDMSSPNMHMRDPIMYRIIDISHHRTGDKWKIYPTYDWTHGQSDFIESISHSLCTLEFEVHRELYEWFISKIPKEKSLLPKQREFARLNLSYTVMSKRKLSELVDLKLVSGWDDPRMPTICGLRRRGIPPVSILNFCNKIGIAKRENIIDYALLEYCARETLNKISKRVMVVLDPIELEIENYMDNKDEYLKAENNPEDESYGYREIPFSKNLYIEREDFKEEANRKFFRLTIGKEVRLKNAYIIKGQSVEKNNKGLISKIYCTYDPLSKSGSGSPESSRKVKGTIHWVSKSNAIKIDVNIYDRLFNVESPDESSNVDFKSHMNKNSFIQLNNVLAEPSIKNATKDDYFQFQRKGYFKLDSEEKDQLIFNRSVTLRDTWKKNIK
jgi:glutaminyl-tRNA synthetase